MCWKTLNSEPTTHLNATDLEKRFIDENEGDQGRERFLSEAREQANQGTGVDGNHDDQEEGCPHADPKAKL